MTYQEILNSFSNRRRDFSFPSSDLELLSDIERQQIEKLIVRNCLEGDSSCFQHIYKLKFYNPGDIFSIDRIQNLDSKKRVILCKILFNVTNDLQYVDYLLDLSYDNIAAYSMLTLLYEEQKLPIDYFDKILDVCNHVDVYYSNYLKILKRIASDEQINQVVKKHADYSDPSGFNHDPKLYDLLTNKETGNDVGFSK